MRPEAIQQRRCRRALSKLTGETEEDSVRHQRAGRGRPTHTHSLRRCTHGLDARDYRAGAASDHASIRGAHPALQRPRARRHSRWRRDLHGRHRTFGPPDIDSRRRRRRARPRRHEHLVRHVRGRTWYDAVRGHAHLARCIRRARPCIGASRDLAYVRVGGVEDGLGETNGPSRQVVQDVSGAEEGGAQDGGIGGEAVAGWGKGLNGKETRWSGVFVFGDG